MRIPDIGCCLDDRCVADILDVLPDRAHMLWTGGFFDDADICVSLLARAGGEAEVNIMINAEIRFDIGVAAV